MSSDAKLRFVVILLLIVIGGGTLGFELIEGWSFLDSFYMTLITITTVGYGEVHPLSPMGRVFVSVLILVGTGAALYGFTVIFELLVEGQVRNLLGRRRMERGIRRMKDHYIVCGYGRVGQRVVGELVRRGKKVVVIETEQRHQDRLIEEKIQFVGGSATDDRTLLAAGLMSARSLIIALPKMADNVLITLTARKANPSIRIIGRTDEERSNEILVMAGADSVVCPYGIGGVRMAIASVSPNVLDFMQIAGGGEQSDIRIDEIMIAKGSSLCDTTLRDSPIRSKLGLMVVALRKSGGAMKFNPDAAERLEAEDIVIVIGAPDKLGTLRDLTAAPEVSAAG